MDEEKRFKIIIYTPRYYNSVQTDNLDSALSKIESMIGKIDIKFEDKELKTTTILKNENDYNKLLNEYQKEV